MTHLGRAAPGDDPHGIIVIMTPAILDMRNRTSIIESGYSSPTIGVRFKRPFFLCRITNRASHRLPL